MSLLSFARLWLNATNELNGSQRLVNGAELL